MNDEHKFDKAFERWNICINRRKAELECTREISNIELIRLIKVSVKIVIFFKGKVKKSEKRFQPKKVRNTSVKVNFNSTKTKRING